MLVVPSEWPKPVLVHGDNADEKACAGFRHAYMLVLAAIIFRSSLEHGTCGWLL